MRATRLQSASKRPALAAAETHLGSPMKIEAKEEGEEKEAEASPPPTRKRAKAKAAMLPPPPTPPAARPCPPPRLLLEPPAGLPERLGSLPLRCVFSGTNPSVTAWQQGHAYAHRSNRFWPLLHSSPGIVPPHVAVSLASSSSAASSSSSSSRASRSCRLPGCSTDGVKTEGSGTWSPFSGAAADDELLNQFAGLGLCDVGQSHPETDLSSISSSAFAAWAPGYYGRLVEHVRRAARVAGCRCRPEGEEEEGGEEGGGEAGESKGGGGGSGGVGAPPSPPSLRDRRHPSTCCAPRVIAFTGKRQFVELLNAGGGGRRDASMEGGRGRRARAAAAPSSGVGYGLQPRSLRPAAWPRCLSETEVWVLTTTSGAAGLTNEARAAPYLELGRRLGREPWPRPPPLCCLER